MKPIPIKRPGSLALVLLCGLLSACLGGGVSKVGTHGIYSLPEAQPLASIPSPAALAGHALQVEVPHALPALNSPDLLVVQADGELQVVRGARWSAPLPVLLQDLLVRQIAQAQIAPSVAAGPQTYAQPLRLVSELRSFGLRQERSGLRAHAELALRLVCNRNAQVLRAHDGIQVSSAAGIPLDQAAASLRALASELAIQTTQWLAASSIEACS